MRRLVGNRWKYNILRINLSGTVTSCLPNRFQSRLLVQKTPTRVGHWFYKIAFNKAKNRSWSENGVGHWFYQIVFNKSKNRFCCTVPCKLFFEILYQDFVFYIKGRVWMESFFSLSILLVSKIHPLFCMEFIRKRRDFWWRDSTRYFDLNNLPKKLQDRGTEELNSMKINCGNWGNSVKSSFFFRKRKIIFYFFT